MTEYVQTATNGRKYIVNCCERCGKITEGIHTCTPNLVIERLTAEIAIERRLSFRTQLAEMDAELVKTRDLAEHWMIIAEQRRVELGECRKDAERYQYLRNIERRECLDLTGPEAGVWCDAENEMGELLLLTEDDLDAAIDAAMGVKP